MPVDEDLLDLFRTVSDTAHVREKGTNIQLRAPWTGEGPTPTGAACRRTGKLHAGNAHGLPEPRRWLTRQRIKPRIAREGTEPDDRLERVGRALGPESLRIQGSAGCAR